ncbi:translocon at the outer membrane of chloroplasts 64 [Rhododendron vialii]|uniref:translocon at the outer membrane of chloroplasts 64 n=1 Tax=Rhododendron vialii TaxID=182163 RepID=UPI00265DE691|nr:translocon at the outer membrane of chloroplasts 64 [Rhododendron vialii]
MASAPANLWVLLGLGLAGILIMTKKLKKNKVVKQDFGAFVLRFQLLPPPQPSPPKAPHPLTGLTFAVSDVFDIDGFVTGFGNLDWERTHEAASQTSSVVSALVEGGATCVGKTVVAEMAYSISGENKNYGTPTNPTAPALIPGGSSSGSAVAVAADLVHFSLGTDTDGGVRVPAGYCGVIGFRPSYGAVSHVGIVPVSSSCDTVGWFAKDPIILRRVGHLLLQVPFAVQHNPRSIIIADDCFQLVKNSVDRVAPVVIKSTEKLFGRQVLKHENLGNYLDLKVPSLKSFHSKKSNGEVKSSSIRLLANVMELVKRHEFKCNHGEWISSVKPTLDPIIAAQIRERLQISDMEIENFRTIRNEIRVALNSLLKDDGILVIPTIPDPPLKLGSKEILSEDYLSRVFSLLSLASMSGCCQVTVPLGFHGQNPVSVSLVARHGGDRFLLDTVHTMYASLQEQADIIEKSKLSAKVVSQETSAEIAKEKGNQAFKDKQWQKAIGFYTEAIRLSGTNATYYSNRAAAYLELGSFLQAEADSSTAINLDRKNVKAYLRRGTAREMLGYYHEAIEDFRYALVLEPTNKRAALSAERLKNLFQ